MPHLNPEEYRKRVDRVTEMFSGMVEHADEQSRTRCPYRDAQDACTALFRCRNQVDGEFSDSPPRCTHDGAFDYRTAWESDPESEQRARQRLGRVRDEAEVARLESTAPESDSSGSGAGDAVDDDPGSRDRER